MFHKEFITPSPTTGMNPSRRGLLYTLGVGGVAIAGCVEGNGSDEDGSEDDGANGNGSDTEFDAATIPFAVRTDRPAWDSGNKGQVIVIDSRERESEALSPYSIPFDRHEEMRAFREGVDYDRERLLLVESVGPNACHDRLEVDSIRAESEEIRAEAAVVDSSDGEMACAQVVTYPSTLVRITFKDEPLDSARAEITDGGGGHQTIPADADDPIEIREDDGPEESDPVRFEGAIRPDEDPEPIAPLECTKEAIRRHPQRFENAGLSWGDVDYDGETVQELRIEETEYDYGDTARIQLTNVSDADIHVGNRAKYNVQAYTESGWQDVRVTDEDRYFEYTDEAINHPAGDTFEWSFELTESGLVEGTFHDHAEVCPDLQTGRYRFAFWGIIDGADAVGVGFDLRKEN